VTKIVYSKKSIFLLPLIIVFDITLLI